MSKISKKLIFCREKTAGGNPAALKQKLGAAARPAAAAAKAPGAAAKAPGAAAKAPGAAARPEPPRRPGGRREAKIRGVPKMLPEPPGGSGGFP